MTTVETETSNESVYTSKALKRTYIIDVVHAITCVCSEGDERGNSIKKVANVISGV